MKMLLFGILTLFLGSLSQAVESIVVGNSRYALTYHYEANLVGERRAKLEAFENALHRIPDICSVRPYQILSESYSQRSSARDVFIQVQAQVTFKCQ